MLGFPDKQLKQEIMGGLGDKSKLSDFDPKELKMGAKVEMEHTNDKSKAVEISTDHLTEIPDYYTRLKKMEDDAEKNFEKKSSEAFSKAMKLGKKALAKTIIKDAIAAKRIKRMYVSKNITKGLKKIDTKLTKTAGGPGSGVQGENASKIPGYPITPDITIMKRKYFMDHNKPFIKGKIINIDDIKYIGQQKFVPKKLKKFITAINNNETWPFEKAIDVTVDSNGKYAVLDGHHRFLAALVVGKKNIKANVYIIPSKPTFEKQAHPGAGMLKSVGRYIGEMKSGKGLKNAGKGLYNLAFGGKTVAGKWDPMHGIKSIGRTKAQYTKGPLKGMYKYDKAGDHIIDMNSKRNWTGYIKDEISGASRTRADLAAKQYAKKEGINVGEYLANATPKQQQHLQSINKMSVGDFIKHDKGLAANYYGRNVLQKGLTVGFPAYTAKRIVTGEAGADDPNSSRLGNNLGAAAEAAGWALTGPLGMAGSLAGVTGASGLAKTVGNKISKPTAPVNLNFSRPNSPQMRVLDYANKEAGTPINY